MSAGRASGKRTLVDLMDEAEEEKKRKRDKELEHKRRKSFDQSRYFSDCRQHTDSVNLFGAGPSRRHTMDGIREGTVDLTQDEVIVIEDEDVMAVDSVTQEDGYLSPSPSISRALTPDLSSPVHPISKTSQKYQDSELISSPQPTQKSRRDSGECHSHTRLRGFAYVGKENDPPRILIPTSPPLFSKDVPASDVNKDTIVPGPDLRYNFDDNDPESEIGYWDDDKETMKNPGVIEGDMSMESTPNSNGPSTPPDDVEVLNVVDSEDSAEDVFELDEDVAARLRLSSFEKVARGWRQKYSLGARSITSQVSLLF